MSRLQFDLQSNSKEFVPSCLFGQVPTDFTHIYSGVHPCPLTDGGTSEVRGVHGHHKLHLVRGKG